MGATAILGGLLVIGVLLHAPAPSNRSIDQAASVAGPGTNPASPPIGTAAEATLTLTEKDDGATKVLPAGTTILVQLRGGANYRWTVPSTSNTEVVQQTGGSQGSDGSATARFLAAAPGRAVLSAIDNPNCFPICSVPPASGWTVTIVVG